jgi:ubiquinone/menaquinone biosynthesis C-methylase UbiE
MADSVETICFDEAKGSSSPPARTAAGSRLATADLRRLRRFWDQQAPAYDREMAFLERVLFDDGRAWVGAQAIGDVLEVAIGTGGNLPFYPPHVRLTGVDLSRAMLAVARCRAAELGRPVALHQGDAQALAFPDASFDTVVCTLSLCGIPDERRAVAEMHRVLRPDGRLVLLDHVAGAVWWVRALQWLIERVSLPTIGEHLRRRPVRQVRAAGFVIERRRRTKLGIIERLVARKPARASERPSLVTEPTAGESAARPRYRG